MADMKVSQLSTAQNLATTDWLLVTRGSNSNKIAPPAALTSAEVDTGTSTAIRFATPAAFVKAMRWMGAFTTNTAKRVGELFTSGGGVYLVDTAVAANANDTVATLKRIDNPPAMTSAQATTGTDTVQRTTSAAIIKAAVEQHAPESGVSDDAGSYVRGLVVAVDSGSGDQSNLTILRGVRSASEVSVDNVPYIMDDDNISESGTPALDADKADHIVIRSNNVFTYKEPIRNQIITVVSDVIDSNDDQGILGRYIYAGSGTGWKELIEGKDNSRTYFNNTVGGEGNTATGQFSTTIGRNNTSSAVGSQLVGRNNTNTAAATYSVSAGQYLHNKRSGTVLVGENGVLATDKRFAVAGGASAPNETQRNASTDTGIVFSVNDSGDAQITKVETPHATGSGSTKIRFHALTQSAFDAISNKDADTFYIING